MSVCLEAIPADGDIPAVEVSASDFDAPELWIEQGDDEIVLTRRQLQALWLAIERFQDR